MTEHRVDLMNRTGRVVAAVLVSWFVPPFGLLDILFVLRTGIGLGMTDPAQMIWITGFPWSLIVTFIVPLVLVTHVLIFVRLWRLWNAPSLLEAA